MTSKRVRRRAVRLTPDAVERLTAALSAKWKAGGGTTKFTWEAKSELLGLSVVTCRRLLNGEGVDRGSTMQAFTACGLEWSESYLLSESSAAVAPEPPAAPPAPARSDRHGARWFAGLAFAVLVGVAIGGHFRKPIPAAAPAWGDEFNATFHEADHAYQRGDYVRAKTLAAKARQMAETYEAVAELATVSTLEVKLALKESKLDEAAQLVRQAIRYRTVLNQEESLPALYESLAEIELQRGNLSESEQKYRLALSGYRKIGERVGLAQAARGLSSVYVKRRKPEEALSWLDVGDVAIVGMGKDDLATDLRSRRAVVLRETGKLSEARSLLVQSREYWERKGHERWLATTEFELGTVALLQNQLDEASRLLGSSAETFRQIGDRSKASEVGLWTARLAERRRQVYASRVGNQ
jgi:tetratricopeptide (TPR) repeat protein